MGKSQTANNHGSKSGHSSHGKSASTKTSTKVAAPTKAATVVSHANNNKQTIKAPNPVSTKSTIAKDPKHSAAKPPQKNPSTILPKADVSKGKKGNGGIPGLKLPLHLSKLTKKTVDSVFIVHYDELHKDDIRN